MSCCSWTEKTRRVLRSRLLSQMVLKEKHFARFNSSVMIDAGHDLTRLARARNKEIDDELRVFLEEDGSMDEDYRDALLCLSIVEKRLDPCKKKNDKDDVTEHKKRSEACKKRKVIKDISKHNDDDCSDGEENDPQYDLFFKHLKVHDKSYVAEFEQGGLPVVIKYEGGKDSKKEGDREPEPRRKRDRAHSVLNKIIPKKEDRRMLNLMHKCRPSNQMGGVENQCKHDRQPVSVKKTCNAVKVKKVKGSPNNVMPDPKHLSLHQNVELGGDLDVIMLKGVVNDKIDDQKREDGRKLLRARKPKIEFSNQMPGQENQWRTSVKKTKGGKSRNEIDKEENHLHQNNKLEDDPSFYMHKGHTMVNQDISGVNDQKKQFRRIFNRNTKLKVEPPNQMSRLENEGKLDPQPTLAKKTKSSPLKGSRNEAQNVRIEKFTASEFRKVKAENNFEKEGKVNSHSEVEILDEAAYFKKGILSPFVPSTKYAMEEDGVQHIGRSSARDEFKKKVLNVLKKPYDKKEYKRHVKAVRDGRYLDYHPDLHGKLKKYRYNRRKRQNILRGFFFWIQNLTQEGAFKPWKDHACLAIEPPSR